MNGFGEKEDAGAALALLERVDDALGSGDPGSMLNEVLQIVLDGFGCDRAYLAMPCHPETESFRNPFISTTPRYSIDDATDTVIEVNAIQRETLRLRFNRQGALRLDERTLRSEEFDSLRQLGGAPGVVQSIKASMSMAIHPPVGPVWGFGIHFCDELHIFSDEEQQIFELIGRRIADALSLWVIQDRLSAVESLEALGTMVADTAVDLGSLVETIDQGLRASGDEKIIALTRETLLMKRVLHQIGALSKRT